MVTRRTSSRATANGEVVVRFGRGEWRDRASGEVLGDAVVVERAYHYVIRNANNGGGERTERLKAQVYPFPRTPGEDWGRLWGWLFDLAYEMQHSGVLRSWLRVDLDGTPDRSRGALAMLAHSVCGELGMDIWESTECDNAEPVAWSSPVDPLRSKILAFVREHPHQDGIYVATVLGEPIDRVYDLVGVMIAAGELRRTCVGWNQFLEAVETVDGRQ